jgi:phospholipid/cholesterol/gamma-HCH transport system substrate-binding protein
MNPVPIGVVSLVFLLLLVTLALNLGRLPFTSGTGYSAAFSEAAGLRSGDAVMVAGVAVGKVTGVSLEDAHVRVDFDLTDGSVHLGARPTASIQIATLLGNKYLSLTPSGSGSWAPDHEIPLADTQAPYDIEPALQGLSQTVQRINTHQLADALNTLATTFQHAPADLRSTLTGLSRLSRTIASRNTELGQLLQRTSAVTGVLAQRRVQFAQLLGDGDKLLTELDQRREVINQLLVNTTRLARQLTGLVHDNQASIGPMLTHLHTVLALLDSNQSNLDHIIKGLYVFVRGEVDATGAGPWFDGTAINVANPISPVDLLGKGSGLSGREARNLAQLLAPPGSHVGPSRNRSGGRHR